MDVVSEMNELLSKCNALPLQINMDEYCGDESEEKNPYPANDYIGNAQTRCVHGEMMRWVNGWKWQIIPCKQYAGIYDVVFKLPFAAKKKSKFQSNGSRSIYT